MRVKRLELLRSLESAAPGLPRGEAVEQSSCFAFRDGRVTAFNDDVAAAADVPLNVVGAVPGVPLLALLRKMTEDELDVDVGGGELTVKGKGRRAGIRMEKELPVDGVEQPGEWKPLPAEFVEAVGAVADCASGDEGRFSLTCVHVHPEWVEACDNFQLCRYPLVTGVKSSTLVPAVSLKHIAGMDAVEFCETEAWLHFRNACGRKGASLPAVVLSCRRWVERYPDLDGLLEVRGVRTVFPEGLAEAVGKAEIFSAENVAANRVTVELRAGRLKLGGRGPSGWYAEQQKVEYDGEPVRFMTLPKMLVEIAGRGNVCEVAEGKLKVVGEGWIYVTATAAAD